MELGELEFKPEDKLSPDYLEVYLNIQGWSEIDSHTLVNLLNDILREKLVKAPEVFGVQKDVGAKRPFISIDWTTFPMPGERTHRARLVMIEEVEK